MDKQEYLFTPLSGIIHPDWIEKAIDTEEVLFISRDPCEGDTCEIDREIFGGLVARMDKVRLRINFTYCRPVQSELPLLIARLIDWGTEHLSQFDTDVRNLTVRFKDYRLHINLYI